MVKILDYTNKEPLSLMGYMAGYCWNSDLSNDDKNIKRALTSIDSGHGRVSEFGDVYITISGYSARMMRELFVHIGGMPTRLQESTRYVEYKEGYYDYVVPPNLTTAQTVTYKKAMDSIFDEYRQLLEIGIKKEDAANALPLGMMSKMVLRINARCLIEMSHQRECSRAYWEFRKFFNELKDALRAYSPQWATLVDRYFMPKCEYFGYCNEKNSCGRKPKKEEK